MSRHLVVRATRPEISMRLPARAVAVSVLLIALILVAVCLTTAYGEFPISLPEVVRAVFGHASSVDNLVVGEFRLPRVIECVLIGAALGLSGAIFQTLTRNPLAAPDIIGVNEGAAVVAVWMLLAGVPTGLVPAGAFAGALVAVAVVALLGVRRRLSMYRLILIGIGINALGDAVVAYLLTHASPANFEQLQVAQQWLVGSTAAATWSSVRVIALAVLIIAPLALAAGRQLNTFQLGDDLAIALGVRTTSLQVCLAGLGALLAAFVVSVAGPIGFVAFICPHIARRLTRTASVASWPAAMAAGGLLLLVADYAAERVLEPNELPVGIATIIIGAPYLLLLLLRAERATGLG